MNVDIVAVGRLKHEYLLTGLDDYLARLSHYCKVSYINVREEPVNQRWSKADIESAKRKEGERLLRHLPRRGTAVALDQSGERLSSEKFASLITRIQQTTPTVSFFIGGSAGLSHEVKRKSGLVLSLSTLTITHQLIPLLLAEQLYRAFKISRGEPYHW